MTIDHESTPMIMHMHPQPLSLQTYCRNVYSNLKNVVLLMHL